MVSSNPQTPWNRVISSSNAEDEQYSASLCTSGAHHNNLTRMNDYSTIQELDPPAPLQTDFSTTTINQIILPGGGGGGSGTDFAAQTPTSQRLGALGGTLQISEIGGTTTGGGGGMLLTESAVLKVGSAPSASGKEEEFLNLNLSLVENAISEKAEAVLQQVKHEVLDKNGTATDHPNGPRPLVGADTIDLQLATPGTALAGRRMKLLKNKVGENSTQMNPKKKIAFPPRTTGPPGSSSSGGALTGKNTKPSSSLAAGTAGGTTSTSLVGGATGTTNKIQRSSSTSAADARLLTAAVAHTKSLQEAMTATLSSNNTGAQQQLTSGAKSKALSGGRSGAGVPASSQQSKHQPEKFLAPLVLRDCSVKEYENKIEADFLEMKHLLNLEQLAYKRFQNEASYELGVLKEKMDEKEEKLKQETEKFEKIKRIRDDQTEAMEKLLLRYEKVRAEFERLDRYDKELSEKHTNFDEQNLIKQEECVLLKKETKLKLEARKKQENEKSQQLDEIKYEVKRLELLNTELQQEFAVEKETLITEWKEIELQNKITGLELETIRHKSAEADLIFDTRIEQLRRTADTAKAENEELIRRLLEETERNKRLQAKCR
ncbi:unnamed protein product [Amoebophrya sp. A120]|nr:unnamed protein product [Amoebophrya sp. A120]|eukprot:GSA120T00014970001.1